MRWPNLSALCAPESEGSEGTGSKDTSEASGKIKIGTKEYVSKDLESAASLYEALQDPETGREIIQTLAQRAGLLDKTGDIKVKPGETAAKAESRVAKALKSKLGKDYEKFADSVGPAFDEILEEMVNERFGERDSETTADNWSKAVDTFTDQYEFTTEIEDTMKEMMADSPPNLDRKGFNSQRYLTRIYKAAIEELGEEIKPKKSSKSSGRAQKGDDLPDFVVRDAPKNYTIDDAIDAAMRGIKFNRK